jgi:hypothetical protein
MIKESDIRCNLNKTHVFSEHLNAVQYYNKLLFITNKCIINLFNY